MTFHKAQIQTLIHEIDGVLNKPSPRLPWVMAGESDQQRQVLEQTRSYLVSLQQQIDSPGLLPGRPLPYPSAPPPEQISPAESAQQVLQAVLQEMSYLRSNVMQPLRTDIENLQQQREVLSQEIRLLEVQRQQYVLPQQQNQQQIQQQIITEFLQSLMGRLQENLTGQVAQMLVNMESQSFQERALTNSPMDAGQPSEITYQSVADAARRLEQLQMLQTQSDQLLLRLDATLRVIFESLQNNIQSYQDSLGQGLDKMHNLGQQGEAMFSALVNRLAQQLGREASTYLQSSIQTTNWDVSHAPLPGVGSPSPGAAGKPLPAGDASFTLQPPRAEEISAAQIDLLLNELETGESRPVLQPPTSEHPPTPVVPPPAAPSSLDLSHLTLVDPPPTVLGDSDDDDITFFQLDQPLPSFRLEDDELTFFQFNDDMTTLQGEADPATGAEGSVTPMGADAADLDSALELLNQLSADLQSDSAPAGNALLEPPARLGATVAQPDASAIAEAPYDEEMSELYESLFGYDAQVGSSDDRDDAPEPVDQHVTDASLALAEPTLSLAAAEPALVDELFGGLHDPAQEEIAQSDAEERTDKLPESLEDLLGEPLFPAVSPAHAAPDAIDRQSEPTEAPQEEAIDAIASLSDLIDTGLAPDSDLTEALVTDSSSTTDEDTFIPAAADEVLLVSADPPAEARASINLDADTLNRLTADLSSLEGLETDPQLTVEADLADPNEPWMLTDLAIDHELDTPSPESLFTADEAAELLAEDAIDQDLSPEPDIATPLVSPVDYPLPVDPDNLPSEITEIFTTSAAVPDASPLPFESETTLEDLFALAEEPESEAIVPDWQDVSDPSSDPSEPPVLSAEGFSAAELATDLFSELQPPPAVASSPVDQGFSTDMTDVDDFSSELQELLSAVPDEVTALPSPPGQSEELSQSELESLFSDDGPEAIAPASFDPGSTAALFSATDGESASTSLDHLFSDDGPAALFADDPMSEASGLTLEELENSLPALPSLAGEQDSGEQDSIESLFSETPSDEVSDSLASDQADLDPAAESLDHLTLADFGDALSTPPVPAESDIFAGGAFADSPDDLFLDYSSTEETAPGDDDDDLFTLAPTVSDGAIASAALHANDAASPPPSMPLDAAINDAASPPPAIPLDDHAIVNDDPLDNDLFTLAAPPVPDVTLASAALHANDAAAPLPAIPLDDHATTDDFFAAAHPDPLEVPLAHSPLPLPAVEPGVEVARDDEANAFTLEGLVGNLFEDVPAIDPSALATAETIPAIGDPALNEVDEAEKKKSLTPEQTALTNLDAPAAAWVISDAQEPDILVLDGMTSETLDAIALEDDSEIVFDAPAFTMLDLSAELGIDPQELEALLETDFTSEDDFPPAAASQDTTPKVWYLGIDVGTTGLSAVLLHRPKGELYPIYWVQPSALEPSQATPASDQTFRLPTRVHLSAPDHAGDSTELTPGFMPQSNLVKVSFAHPATTSHQSNPIAIETSTATSEFLLQDFKPYLKIGIPYYSAETSCWEPVLQWSEHQQISLSPIHQALRALVSTLNVPHATTRASEMPTCAAVGLEDEEFQAAVQQLAGVIVGYPANWSDTYSFNLREAVLGSRLVAHPDQIFLVEDVIATLLSGLRSGDGRAVVLPSSVVPKNQLHNADWQGLSLVINAGAASTDLALVDLPNPLRNLTYQDFHLRSLPYAGHAIDLDIICQLIYPTWVQQSQRPSSQKSSHSTISYTFGSGNGTKSGTFMDGWNWQPDAAPAITPETWDLGLADLPLPVPGEPDLQTRDRLQQRLASSPLGQGLLEAARYLKLNLQQQDRLTLRLGDQDLTITRQDLGSRVFLPFIQRLNRELNALLNQTHVSTTAINQVICTGGTASLGAIARWLREKFPNATIIQDTYNSNPTPSPRDNCLPTCSRVAYGLATLPLHSHALNQVRQRYSDYFLLLEILRVFPDEAMTAADIMQQLEQRGIDTQACHSHILALLEGHLPPGLVPTERDAHLLTPESRQNLDYQTLLAAPLFDRQNNQTYRPNYDQWNHFRRYLSTIMSSTYQKLTEPLNVGLPVMDE